MKTSRASVDAGHSGSLIRALGVADLTWLYVVAIVNLNVVPVVAAEGMRSGWLWLAAIAFFFLPQAIGVLELAERMPGEGGLYLWAGKTFGEFHGFLCGWCYWLTNMFFVPSLLFYISGVTAYIWGTHSALSGNRVFFWLLTNGLLWLTIIANIRGLGVGKWVNNIGGVGALGIAGALIALGAVAFVNRGHAVVASAQQPAPLSLSAIGMTCLAMVGLEIGPVMGDEVRSPRRTFPLAILFGGILSAIAYVGSTLALASSVPQSQIAVVEGLMQAIDRMSAGLGLEWILLPLAVLMIVSIAGSTSAWVSGSARILFVSGMDSYLPASLGKIHPRHGSPYVALSMFGVLASIIISMSFAGATVQEAFLTLLDLSVALQMISYMYLFASLARRAFDGSTPACFAKSTLRPAAAVGLAMTVFSFTTAFIPSRQITSLWLFELKMLLTLALLLGVGIGLFRYYSRPARV